MSTNSKERIFKLLRDTDEALRDVRAENLDGSEPAIGELLERNTALFIELEKAKAAVTLQDWRVLYTSDGDSEIQAMRFQAEDVAHAIEQFEDACSPGDCIAGVMREESFTLLPTNSAEYVQRKGRGNGSWITLRNVAIHLTDREKECCVDLHPLGRDDDDEIESATAGYALTALNALIDGDDSPGAVRSYCEVLDPRAIKAHLAELEGDGEGIHDRLSEALAEQLN